MLHWFGDDGDASLGYARRRGAGGGVHASGTFVLPPTKRTVVWRFIEIKHGKDVGHLIETVLVLVLKITFASQGTA